MGDTILSLKQWERRAVLESSRSFIFYNYMDAYKRGDLSQVAEFEQKLSEVDKEIENLTATINEHDT